MPVMDGPAATKKIREVLNDEFGLAREHQPTIVGVTGHVEASYQKPGLDAGMDEILSKPLYKDDLHSALVKYGLLFE